ncbi:Microtubule-destabilizing protein 60 [Linum grandiflorum]
MDSSIKKNRKPTTPAKESRSPHGFHSKALKSPAKVSENANPNVSRSISMVDSTSSPLAKSGCKSHKSGQKIPNSTKTLVPYSPRNKLHQRKFVVAKKKNPSKEDDKVSSSDSLNCKCKNNRLGGIGSKCLCVAYESLRASQEEFFKIRNEGEEMDEGDNPEVEQEEAIMVNGGSEDQSGSEQQEGSSTMKRRREKFLEDVRNSVSHGGKVMHLVKAFEKLLTEPKALEDCLKEEDEEEDEEEKCSSFCPSEMFLTSENLGLDPKLSVSSSWDASQGSVSSGKSNGGRRSRRNSSESCATMGGSRWKKKQQKVTSLKPFKLRTEQRGKTKEEEFMKKIHEMMTEEERQRIPIAQGLPWTTDEPEHLIKPPVKEITRPIDLMLHSDIRAEERAEFDHQVSEKLTLIEEYKTERERLQKLAEEEEVRRLRKELVPKAQPMPYFDRPFIPRRSMKQPTVPKEPRFHVPQYKKIKCGSSWSDLSTFTFHQ